MMIKDIYGRTLNDLRVSLTTVCNFGCTYCVTPGEVKKYKGKNHRLHYEELANIVIRLHETLQLKSVRLTGGEPTLYKELIPFIKLLSAAGLKNIRMTTNGLLLKEKAELLSLAEIKEINVSLDAVDEDVFFSITGKKDLKKVLEGIEEALNNSIIIKLNAVIMKNKNGNQVMPLLEYAISKNLKIRYLELMRMGYLFTRDFDRYFFASKEILEIIKKNYRIYTSYREKSATARYYVIDNGYEFGIIANESEPFCSDCSRLRLDSYGNIYGCLSENKYENISENFSDDFFLEKKLNEIILHKQPLKFKGSSLRMIEVGG